MTDQQDTGFGVRAGDDVVGTPATWDRSSAGGTGQGMPSSFAGQPIDRGEAGNQGGAGSAVSTAGDKASQMAEQAGSMLDTARERATQVTDQAASTVDTGMDKAASGLDTLAGTLRDRGESMGGGSVASIATTAADKLEAGAQLLREKDTDQLVRDLEALVRRKPVESVLVAVGIGFVLSKIVR